MRKLIRWIAWISFFGSDDEIAIKISCRYLGKLHTPHFLVLRLRGHDAGNVREVILNVSVLKVFGKLSNPFESFHSQDLIFRFLIFTNLQFFFAFSNFLGTWDHFAHFLFQFSLINNFFQINFVFFEEQLVFSNHFIQSLNWNWILSLLFAFRFLRVLYEHEIKMFIHNFQRALPCWRVIGITQNEECIYGTYTKFFSYPYIDEAGDDDDDDDDDDDVWKANGKN
jgi:hypothetical protein